jgi:tRNA A-37 threonylcarbamoyl transferase component Bud32
MEEPRSRVGEVLAGKYHLERLLGSGGMGSVYEALHAFTQRRVAVKLMHPHIARSRIAAERFVREARAPGSIGHTGIVEVLDGGHAEDGSLYLVMEVLHGETLSAALKGRRMHLQEIAEIVLELLDILDAAHAAGFVHRDIKPENVFLQHAGDAEIEIKLLDFGVAGVIANEAKERSSDPKLTRAGAVLGTPLYMSPEQALGRSVDARADLWSVGALLYQALAGAPPYGGDSFQSLVVSIATQDHVPIGALRPDLPPRVHAVIERALRKDPEKRWSSAREMAGALASAVEGRSTANDANTLGMSALPSEPSAPLNPPRALQADGLTPLRMIALGMGAVIALGAIAYIVTLGPGSHATAPVAETATIEPVAEPSPVVAAKSPVHAAVAPAVVAPAGAPAAVEADAIEVKEASPTPQAQQEAPTVPAPVPVTAPAPPPAHGLSSEALASVLSTAQGELQRCYEQAMVAALTAGQPPLPAVAYDVSLRVAPAGRVERAQVTTTSTSAPPAVRACLQGVIDGLHFPTAGAASEARFPVVFQPAVVGP